MLLCLGLSAFFSSSETAFIASQRIRLKHLEHSGEARAKKVARVMERPERFLATVLLGNNLVNTAAAVLGMAIATYFLGQQKGMLAATIGVTLLLLFLGEAIPKTIGARYAERVALFYIAPMELILWLASPFARVIEGLTSRINKALRGDTFIFSPSWSEGEIRTAISLGHEEGVVEKTEAEMLHKVFEFGDIQAKKIMAPRLKIVALERNAKLTDLLALYPESPYSRFPVYEGSIDNIVGILSIKDVLIAQAQGSLTSESSLEGLLRPAYFVPETKVIGELLAEMQSQGYHLAIVIDEFGATAGVITMEQLVEEIVGKLRDELAKPARDMETIDEHTFQIEGSTRIEDINEQLGLNLPSGDYETIAGFLLFLLGHIPQEGEQVKHEGLKFVVTGMKGRRIEKVLVTREQKGNATTTP